MGTIYNEKDSGIIDPVAAGKVKISKFTPVLFIDKFY
jgi:hypothetical protein